MNEIRRKKENFFPREFWIDFFGGCEIGAGSSEGLELECRRKREEKRFLNRVLESKLVGETAKRKRDAASDQMISKRSKEHRHRELTARSCR